MIRTFRPLGLRAGLAMLAWSLATAQAQTYTYQPEAYQRGDTVTVSASYTPPQPVWEVTLEHQLDFEASDDSPVTLEIGPNSWLGDADELSGTVALDTASDVLTFHLWRNDSTPVTGSGYLCAGGNVIVEIEIIRLRQAASPASDRLYPQPARHKVRLETAAAGPPLALDLLDLQGRSLRQFAPQSQYLDLRGLPAGRYWLRLRRATGFTWLPLQLTP